MDRISALLERLADLAALSDEDLDAAEAELVEIAEEIAAGESSEESVAALGQIAEALDGETGIRAERGVRTEASATRAAEQESLLARIRAEEPETPAAEDGEGEGGNGEGEEAPAEEPAETPAEEEEEEEEEPAEEAPAEAIAASAPRRVPLAALQARNPSPARTRNAGPQPRVVAAQDLRSFHGGQQIDWDQAAQAMCERLESIRGRYDGPPVSLRVGTMEWAHTYPEARRLANDAAIDTPRVRAITDPGGTRGHDSREALVAAGGLCAPTEVRYELESVGTTARPLRDALPSFDASRGGLRYNPPSVLSSVVVDNTSGAIDTITVADDAGGASKTVQEFTCPTTLEVQVYALSERGRFGNFADRYNPEKMRADMHEMRKAHSRRAERGLLEGMRTASTLVNGGAVELGAYRQYIANLTVAAAGLRYRHRMDESETLRAVIPRWLLGVLFIDLAWQQPGDNTLAAEAEALLTRALGNSNVRPIFQIDDARTNDANGAGAPAFGAQSAGALNEYPGRVSTLLYPEGSFLYLDGGSLDFGITRDSTLNALNRFETFFEVFENVAFVGVESLNLTTLICASGASSLPIAAGCGGTGS